MAGDITLTISIETLIGDGPAKIATMLQGVAKLGVEFATLGDKMSDARRAAGLTRQELELLREATGGEIDDLKLLQATAGLTVRGLSATGEQLAGMARLAKLAEDAGGDFTETYQKLGQAAVSGGRGLSRMGIDAQGATSQGAILNKILEESNRRVAELGNSSDTAGDALARIDTSFENFKLALAESFSSNENLVRSLNRLQENLGLSGVEAADLGTAFAEFAADAIDALQPLITVAEFLWNLVVKIGDFFREVVPSVERLQSLGLSEGMAQTLRSLSLAPVAPFAAASALAENVREARAVREAAPEEERRRRPGRPGGGGGGGGRSDTFETLQEQTIGRDLFDEQRLDREGREAPEGFEFEAPIIDAGLEQAARQRRESQAEMSKLMGEMGDMTQLSADLNKQATEAAKLSLEDLRGQHELERAELESDGVIKLDLRRRQIEEERALIGESALTERDRVEATRALRIEEIETERTAIEQKEALRKKEMALVGQWANAIGSAVMQIAGAAGLGQAEQLYLSALFHGVQAAIAFATLNPIVGLQETAAAAAALIGAQQLEARSKRSGAKGSIGGRASAGGSAGGGMGVGFGGRAGSGGGTGGGGGTVINQYFGGERIHTDRQIADRVQEVLYANGDRGRGMEEHRIMRRAA